MEFEVAQNEAKYMDFETEIEEFFEEPSLWEEIDIDYEFDAPKYYDFSRPETELEAEEAERWLLTAGDYPPSPFVLKFNWRPIIGEEVLNNSSISKAAGNINGEIDDNRIGLNHYYQEAKGATRAKAKSIVKPVLLRNSTFMNPTASQLAKQNYTSEIHWEQLLRRSPELLIKKEKNLCSSSATETQATKRQKLEAGYLHKVSHLKHHALLLHKVPKKAGIFDTNTAVAKPKVTIPREPNLATACRAERRRIFRFKTNLGSAEYAKADACTFKARPLNRKILKAPSLPILRKSSPQLPEFQVFHLRTLERAMHHASVVVGDQKNIAANVMNSSFNSQDEGTEYRGMKSDPILKEKAEALDKSKSLCVDKKIFANRREISVLHNNESRVHFKFNFSTENTTPNEPPIESFSKLSLASEIHSNPKSQAKMPQHSEGSKENAPDTLHQENESQWLNGSNYQCGSGQRMHSVGPQTKFNRSLDIR